MQNEPPSGQQTVDEKPGPHGSWTPYPTTNTFGTSFGIKPTTDSQRPPNLPVRGGIQVLPPVVPPRAVNGNINGGAPVATPRPKPKPPLPPKRDELTRLTTVRRDAVNQQPPSTPVRPQRSDDLPHQQLDQGIPDVVPTHVKSEEKQVDTCPPEIPPRPEESALRVLQQCDLEEKIPEEELPNNLELPRPDEEELPQENSIESPSSEDGATADIWVRVIESPIKKRPSGEELTSQPSSRHASTSDDGEERDIKPPLKKDSRPPPKHRVVLDKSYIKCIKDSSDNVNPIKNNEAQNPSSVDQSNENAAQQLTSNQCTNISNDPAKRVTSRVVVGSESLPCSRPSSRATSRSSSPASFIGEKPSNTKPGRISAAEALGVVAKPCPRPPSSKRPKQPQEYRRQSLGNLSDSKLSVSYDPSCSSISCTIRGLWSSVGETEAVSEAVKEYRKHDRTHRGSSADGSRTLSRIKFDCGHPQWDITDSLQGYLDRESHHTGYSTLSRIGRSKTEKYFARSTTPVQSGYSSGDSSSIKEDVLPKKNLKSGKSEKLDGSGRPKSTCNCGHHTASSVRVDTGKRTFSVEELTSAFARQCSEFSRASSGSGSARGSFGKSPRVTFALAEDMGASGGAIAKHPEADRPPVGGASKKILRGKSLPNPSTDSDDGGDPRAQQKQFQGGGSLPPCQSNRSQPAIGLKQTPKSRPTIFGTVASDLTPKEGGNCRRGLPQTTVQGGVTNGAAGAEHPLEPGPEPIADHDNALVYRDGNLVSGSLDALIQHTVPTTDYYPDRAFLFAFLLSSRLYIKPHELLGRVTTLCDSQQKLSDKQSSSKECPGQEKLGRFIPRLVQLMAEWSETFPYDFRDERVMAHVRGITQRCVSMAGTAGEARVRHEVSSLLQNLLHRLTALEKYEEFLQRVGTESTTNNIEALNMTDITDVCPNASTLAQQLTHIELERLSFIGPEEFVQAFAKDNPQLETSFKDMKKTRNLESYVSWFNRLSYFVATEVVKHAKKKQRVRVVEFWIETARECFNMCNFNSLMAIIAGLNMSPISRLKKTWNKVQTAKFSVLEHQMDPSSNFCNYRSTLKAAMWRSAGATDQSQRIVIPFFSLLVKDLYFLNEGCSNKLPNGHINFEKFWQLAKQVTEFITWKQVTCPFEKNPKVITFLQASPILTENALALASFECEPPENSLEKERCKSLKAELAL